MSSRLRSILLVVIFLWAGFFSFAYWQRAALFRQYPYPPAACVAGILFVSAVFLTAVLLTALHWS